MYVQFSWQTSRPRSHFVSYTKSLNSKFWVYYPIENCYDWYYDYHIHDVRLGNVKYYTLPKQIKSLLNSGVITFVDYTKYSLNKRLSVIGDRNAHVVGALQSVCNFKVSLHPNQSLVNYDMYALDSIVDLIHRRDDERLLTIKDSRSLNPFVLNSHSDDIIMQLTGLGYNIVSIMRKIIRAREKYLSYE